MTIRTDPEGSETDALFELADLDGAQVLEIGCGDGRLTDRYADRTKEVTAIEPFKDAIERAKRGMSQKSDRITFRHATFEDFASGAPDASFDVAILSWSLC
jgi:2-polyprenyl-3-methyl-5-hydroxy-6-metoxy-1,4-benzoquinol methylase